MKKFQSIAAVTVLCACLGVMIGLQFNTVKAQSAATENWRMSELSASLRKTQEENAALQSQLDKQEALLAEYESGETISAAMENLQQENERLRAFAGLTEVTGAGIVVTMDDSQWNMGGDQNAYLVHAEDILQVVNELYGAGAQAVSVNGERMVAQSSITCAGTVISVNGVRVAAPFTIQAVGEPSVLQAALQFPGGIVDTLSPWGILIEIRQETQVQVPAYTQSAVWKETAKEEETA